MKKVAEYSNLLVASDGFLSMIVKAPDDLREQMDGSFLEDNFENYETPEAGLYSVDVEVWFEQGYFEGYPAPGESSVYLRAVKIESREGEVEK